MNRTLLKIKQCLASSGKQNNHFTIKQFYHHDSDKNEYMLINQGEAALIDVRTAYAQVEDIIRQSRLALKYILITHAHPSHLTAIPKIKAQFGGIFCIHPDDSYLLENAGEQIEPDFFIKDKTILDLGDGKIQVLHTPGHTDGSVCFYIRDMDAMFSGRTLERGGYGPIWGPTSMYQMLDSLRRLNNTFYSTKVYPGRGEITSIPKEAWLNCLRSH